MVDAFHLQKNTGLLDLDTKKIDFSVRKPQVEASEAGRSGILSQNLW